MKYGNGVYTSFTYDEKTFRLKRLLTEHIGYGVHQGQHFYYDPAGNITWKRDDAFPTHFSDNQAITADNKYTYDALYRLIEATGRENNAAIAFGAEDNYDNSPHLLMHGPADPMQTEQYNEFYSYDEVGNILTLDHEGGGENCNKYIDRFIAKLSGHKITKIRALKDIRFSNSPVEAIHRSIKGRYLRNRKFESIRALNVYLEWAVNDYNVERPHYKHRPRTPAEVYFGKKLDFELRDRVLEAIKNRVQQNKCAKCLQCSGFCKNQ